MIHDTYRKEQETGTGEPKAKRKKRKEGDELLPREKKDSWLSSVRRSKSRKTKTTGGKGRKGMRKI